MKPTVKKLGVGDSCHPALWPPTRMLLAQAVLEITAFYFYEN